MWHTLLIVLKFSGIIATGISGIVAAATESRQDGRLTVWGRRYLIIGIGGFLIALGAQIVEVVVQIGEQEELARYTSDQVSKSRTILENVLIQNAQADRMLVGIDNQGKQATESLRTLARVLTAFTASTIRADFTLRLPQKGDVRIRSNASATKMVEEYRERLMHFASDWRQHTVQNINQRANIVPWDTEVRNGSHYVKSVLIHEESEYYPNGALRDAIADISVRLTAYKYVIDPKDFLTDKAYVEWQKTHKASESQPDWLPAINVSLQGGKRFIKFDVDTGDLWLRVTDASGRDQHRATIQSIVSLEDFRGVQIFINAAKGVGDTYSADPAVPISISQASQLNIETLTLATQVFPAGRLLIPGVNTEGMPFLHFQFPSNIESIFPILKTIRSER